MSKELCRVSIDENNYQNKLEDVQNSNYILAFENVLRAGKTPSVELAQKAHREWLATASQEDLDAFFGGY